MCNPKFWRIEFGRLKERVALWREGLAVSGVKTEGSLSGCPGDCTVVGVSTYSGVLNSGVSKNGSPSGEGGLAVSVGEKESGGELGVVSSEGFLNGSIQRQVTPILEPVMCIA